MAKDKGDRPTYLTPVRGGTTGTVERDETTPPPDPQANPGRERRPVGRPSKLTPRTALAICGIIRTGLPIRDAAAATGTNERTIAAWRQRGREALDTALTVTGIIEDDGYDGDEVLAAVPDEDRPFVDFLWRFDAADAAGAADLAMRVNASDDPRVLLQLLRYRRPEQFRERIEIDSTVVVQESDARRVLAEKVERLSGVIETTATETDTAQPAPGTPGSSRASRGRRDGESTAKPARRRQTTRTAPVR